MRILGLSGIALGHVDGASTHWIQICSNMQRLGADVLSLAPTFMPPETSLPFSIAYVPTGKREATWTIFWHLLSPLWLLYYTVVFRPDVVYSRSHLLMLPVLVTKLTGIPFVIEMNADKTRELQWEKGIRRRLAGFWSWLEKTPYQLADLVLPVTSQLADIAVREYGVQPDRCRVVSNGFCPEVFYPRDRQAAKRSIGLDVNRHYLVFVALLSKHYSVDALVKGFGIVAGRRPDVDLLIVGDGPCKPEMMEAYARAGLGDRVIFTGMLPEDKAAEYIGASVCGLAHLEVDEYAKRVGASPIKVFSYLGCGRPVIAARVPTLAEILIEGRCGLVLEDETPETFARAVMHLLDDPAEADAMGRRGYELAMERYTWEAVARQTLAYITEAIHAA